MSDPLKALSVRLPRRLMLIIALLQGLALLVLYRAETRDQWLSTVPLVKYPLWAIAILLPLMLLLALNSGNVRRSAIASSVYVGFVAVLMVYVGWQATPVDEFPVGALITTTLVTIFISSFKAQMYIQQWASDLPREYHTLFVLSWRNFLVPSLAALFMLLCFAILRLWAALFDTIGIGFFSYLFGRDWFIFPVLSSAFGVGIIVFRELDQVLDTLTRLAQGAISLLLPIVAVITLGYVATLMVVGTDLLWQTGWGTAQMLWLMALVLFFVNAVYQDGQIPPAYSRLIHYVVAAGVGVLLIPACLSAYGLYLRIDQYGVSVSRAHAVVVWFVLSLFIVGYVVMMIRHRSTWPAELGRINQGMSLVIIAILLLLNSPLGDLRKLTVSAQLERLDDGRITPEDFDVGYVRRHLARPGFQALQALKDTTTDEALLAKLQRAAGEPGKPADPEVLKAQIERLTEVPVPAALEDKLASREFVMGERTILTSADLNHDGNPEFIVLNFSRDRLVQSRYLIERRGEWRVGNLDYDFRQRDDVLEAILPDANATVVRPELDDVIIGNMRFRPAPAPREAGTESRPAAIGPPATRPDSRR